MDPLSLDEAPSTQPAAPRRPASAFVREIIETLLLTFFIFWVVNSLVGRYRIDGTSMNPTLLNGEYLIISNFAYQLDAPERGDIIVFRHPRSELNLIKRVIGLPGDTIEVQNGSLSVNGVRVDEPYIQAAPAYLEARYRLLDVNGREILSGKIDREKTTLDVRELPRGIYFLSLAKGRAVILRWVK